MGSIMSAIRDDDEDWSVFRALAQLPFAVKWGVYSKEARYAREVHNKSGLTGEYLVEVVELMCSIDEVHSRFKDDKKEYEQYLALKQKFGTRG